MMNSAVPGPQKSFEVIVIPSDERLPRIDKLFVASLSLGSPDKVGFCFRSGLPSPEMLMDYTKIELGPRSWRCQNIEALEGMNTKFEHPYIIFFPIVSSDGHPFPVNSWTKEIQGPLFMKEAGWRGTLIVAKYRSLKYEAMIDASMADFPIIKNYLSNHGCCI